MNSGDWMSGFLPPFRVGLLVTERCDAGCAHCWFDCKPEYGDTVSLYDAQNYIDAASKIPSVEWISFTGGEPMLFPTLVERLVEYASGLGLKTELVTSCLWAETPCRTEETLRRLRDAGLDILNLSTDDFHQAFIPFERVRNSYIAARSLGVKMVIMTTLSYSSRLKLKDIAKLLGDEIPPPSVADPFHYAAIGIESSFVPVGRGKSIPKGERLLSTSSIDGGCSDILRDIGVKPSGDVLACCSASAILPAFNIGNLNNRMLNEILEDARDKELFKTLHNSGPILLESAKNGLYVNKCSLCYEAVKCCSY